MNNQTFKPGVYCSPFFIFRNTTIDTIRYGSMELNKEDMNGPYYRDMYIQRRCIEVDQENGKNIAYLEV